MRRHRHPRSGIAAVEFALCLPVMIAFVFGVVETSNAVYLQGGLTSAAYEAANVVSATGGTSANAQTRATAVMTALGVSGGSCTISPAVTSATALGTTLTITCTAPLASNSMMFGVLGNRTMTARIVTKRL